MADIVKKTQDYLNANWKQLLVKRNIILLPKCREEQLHKMLHTRLLNDIKNSKEGIELAFGRYLRAQHGSYLQPLAWDQRANKWKLPFGSRYVRPDLLLHMQTPHNNQDLKASTNHCLLWKILVCRLQENGSYLYVVPFGKSLSPDEKTIYRNNQRIVECSHLGHVHDRASEEAKEHARLLSYFKKDNKMTIHYQSVVFIYKKDYDKCEEILTGLPSYGDAKVYQ